MEVIGGTVERGVMGDIFSVGLKPQKQQSRAHTLMLPQTSSSLIAHHCTYKTQ